VLDGRYELIVDGVSHTLTAGVALHAIRGSVHTFRNVGTMPGKMLIAVVPGGFDKYLEEISKFSVPNDMPAKG
jgi:quercetin dioxygenase-like cupin family protein